MRKYWNIIECKYYLALGRILGLEGWMWIGKHPMNFWRGRIRVLRGEDLTSVG